MEIFYYNKTASYYSKTTKVKVLPYEPGLIYDESYKLFGGHRKGIQQYSNG